MTEGGTYVTEEGYVGIRSSKSVSDGVTSLSERGTSMTEGVCRCQEAVNRCQKGYVGNRRE